MPAVENTVRDFIVANFLFGDSGRAVGDDDSMLEHGIIDSTGILELVFFLESTYCIAIDDKDMIPANLDSIARIASFVGRKTARAG